MCLIVNEEATKIAKESMPDVVTRYKVVMIDPATIYAEVCSVNFYHIWKVGVNKAYRGYPIALSSKDTVHSGIHVYVKKEDANHGLVVAIYRAGGLGSLPALNHFLMEVKCYKEDLIAVGINSSTHDEGEAYTQVTVKELPELTSRVKPY